MQDCPDQLLTACMKEANSETSGLGTPRTLCPPKAGTELEPSDSQGREALLAGGSWLLRGEAELPTGVWHGVGSAAAWPSAQEEPGDL